MILVVNYKRRRSYKTSAIFNSEVTSEADPEVAHVFYGSWIVETLQFDCSEDKVFVTRSDSCAYSKIGKVVKDQLALFRDECQVR